MATSGLEDYYESQEEPIKGCLFALRYHLLNFDPKFEETYKWGLPFFMYKKKNFCYFHIDKITREVYIGIYKGRELEHPLLLSEGRTIIKVYRINPSEDFNLEALNEVLLLAMSLYD